MSSVERLQRREVPTAKGTGVKWLSIAEHIAGIGRTSSVVQCRSTGFQFAAVQWVGAALLIFEFK